METDTQALGQGRKIPLSLRVGPSALGIAVIQATWSSSQSGDWSLEPQSALFLLYESFSLCLFIILFLSYIVFPVLEQNPDSCSKWAYLGGPDTYLTSTDR